MWNSILSCLVPIYISAVRKIRHTNSYAYVLTHFTNDYLSTINTFIEAIKRYLLYTFLLITLGSYDPYSYRRKKHCFSIGCGVLA